MIAPARQERSNARQRGAALLTAMIIVALIATLASSMVWAQFRSVQVEVAERSRVQSYWILAGALDWARLILREDARENQRDAGRGGAADHLGEPWAVPLAEARLSTFLNAENTGDDDGPEAFLSGAMTDMQALFNLRNLADRPAPPDPNQPGGSAPASDPDLATMQRLCEFADVPPSVAGQIADALRAASPTTTVDGSTAPAQASGATLMPETVDQLSWLGLDAATIAKLKPFVTILPKRTPVNLNTAPKEVIAAVLGSVDLASADRLMQQRQRDPLRRPEDVSRVLGSTVVIDPGRAGFTSNYFEVRGQLRLDDQLIEERSLVERNDLQVTAIRRERVTGSDFAATLATAPPK